MASELMLVNPRRRRRTHHRRSHKRRVHHRRRRASTVTVVTANPRRRRVHRRRRRVMRMRRNPTSIGAYTGRRHGIEGFINETIIPSGVGALGAIILDTALNYFPLPASLMTPTLDPFVRLGGAMLIGMAGDSIAGRRTGNQLAAGAVTVTLYNIAANWFGGGGGYVAPSPIPAVAPPTSYGNGYTAPAYQTGYYNMGYYV